MVSVNVEITAEDSPIPNALDLYYSSLVKLTAPNPTQRLALNSTLVTFDILPDAPMYTEYVFRAFADRTVTVSPTSFAAAADGFSDVALGAGDTNDRYSKFYIELLRQAIGDLDGQLDQETKDKIALIERDISVLRAETSKFYEDMFKRWELHAAASGLKPDDPYYLDKQTSYFTVMNFATQLQYYRETIGDKLQSIFWLRESKYANPEDRNIASLLKYATLSDYLVARPSSPLLEEFYKYDPIKLGQMYIYGNLNYVESAPEINPSGFLAKFITNVGERGFSITQGDEPEYKHDESWSMKGSGRKLFFFKASTDSKYEKQVRESINSTISIEIKFENLAEYWINRGKWFSSSVFDYQKVKEILDRDTRLAGLLGNCISSIIIGRGMSVTYKFSSVATFSEWEKFSGSLGGGLSFFGMGRASTKATTSNYTLSANKATDGFSVTFLDSPDHVRLIGFKVDKMFDGAEELGLANAKFIDEIDMEGKFAKLASLKSIGGSNDLAFAQVKALLESQARERIRAKSSDA